MWRVCVQGVCGGYVWRVCVEGVCGECVYVEKVCMYVCMQVCEFKRGWVGVGRGYAKQSKLPPRHAVWKTPFTENPGRRINLISVKTVSKHVTHSSNPLDSSCLILWQYSRQYQLHRMITLSSTPSSLPTSSPSSTLTVTTLPFPAITTTSLHSHHHPSLNSQPSPPSLRSHHHPPFPAITTTSLPSHHHPSFPAITTLPSQPSPPSLCTHHYPLLPSSLLPPHHLPLSQSTSLTGCL